MAHPKFEGWREVSLDAKIQSGDVWVWLGVNKPPDYYAGSNHPSHGVDTKSTVGDIQRSCLNYPTWLAYRKVGVNAYKPHPHFGQILPLP